MKKKDYIKFMKECGYVTTPRLQTSHVEIWDEDFSQERGYLYFIKLKKKKK